MIVIYIFKLQYYREKPISGKRNNFTFDTFHIRIEFRFGLCATLNERLFLRIMDGRAKRRGHSYKHKRSFVLGNAGSWRPIAGSR